jgi:hypothetical protein
LESAISGEVVVEVTVIDVAAIVQAVNDALRVRRLIRADRCG